MVTKGIKDVCRVELPIEAANMLEAKKKLDECYDTLAKVHEDIIGYERGFEDKLAGGYVVIKDLITALMAESIENTSTKSQYKVI